MSDNSRTNEQNREPLSKNERIRLHNERIRRAKRRKKRVFVTVVLTAAVAVIAFLVFFVFFRAQSIRVEGESRYSDRDIAAASGIENDTPLLLLKSDDIRNRITTTLVYIGDVQVQKQLSGAVVLTVSETEAAYYINTTGGIVLFDASGKVLEYPAAEVPENCAAVIGLGEVATLPGYAVMTESNEKAAVFFELSERFRAANLGKITKIDISDSKDLRVELDGTYIVTLGDVDNLAYKLSIVEEVLAREQGNAVNRTITIDVSSGSKAYVRNAEHTTAAPTEPADDSGSDVSSDVSNDTPQTDGEDANETQPEAQG